MLENSNLPSRFSQVSKDAEDHELTPEVKIRHTLGVFFCYFWMFVGIVIN